MEVWFVRRRQFLFASTLACAIGSIASAQESFSVKPLPIKGRMPLLKGAVSWVNSPPLAAGSLRGKVVLVQFWTYSCINWLRTLPYLRAWHEKYGEKGLVVVGVHSPEFEFEKDPENVRWAVQEMQIRYPVAVDSSHEIWGAFENQYWPALYFVDQAGRIRHHQFGEGEYAKSERVIQWLLAEAGEVTTPQDLVAVDAYGLEAAADWDSLQSSEIYLGYARARGFASTGGLFARRDRVHTIPVPLAPGQWALSGSWTIKSQSVSSNSAHGRTALRFRARDLHAVMGPTNRGSAVQFRVLIDGEAPGLSHGVDTDELGNGTITEPRLYQLIRQSPPISGRLVEIEFPGPGVEIYSFTFG
jgi:thiol-disulfide isomerase/thioredoxin